MSDVVDSPPGQEIAHLTENFLGSIAEICLVTPDIYRSMDGFLLLGVGPFKVFEFNEDTVHSMEYRGNPTTFSLRVAFAQQGPLAIELMQPRSGPSLMRDYLWQSQGKEGIQHVAFDLGNIPMADRKREFAKRGFGVGMEGIWKGKKGQCHFAFFDTEDNVGTVMESIEFSPDWEDPDYILYPPKASAEADGPTDKADDAEESTNTGRTG